MVTKRRKETTQETTDSKEKVSSKKPSQDDVGPVIPYKRMVVRFVLLVGSILALNIYTRWGSGGESFASSKDDVQRRAAAVSCSKDYDKEKAKYPECFPKRCGRVVMDKVVSQADATHLLRMAKAGLAHGGSNGGASILDMHSGALSKGSQFINIYKIMENTNEKIFTEADFKIYKKVKNAIHRTIAAEFGIPLNKLHLTSPTFFSRMNTKPAKTVHDEYWHKHVDKGFVVSFLDDDEEHIITVPDIMNQSIQSLAEEKINEFDHEHSSEYKAVRDQPKKTSAKRKKRKKVQLSECSSVPQDETPISSTLQDKLKDTSRDELLKFISTAIELHPDLWEILPQGTTGPDPSPPERADVPWCHCGRCRQMPLPEEQLCCRRNPGPCILVTSEGAIGHAVLSRLSLLMAIRHANDMFAFADQPSNDTYRHAAYRQFVLWKYTRLGSGNRVVIPSCVVWAIRDRYPSTDGTYTGFKVSRYH